MALDCDEILAEMGQFGRYQVAVYLLVSLPVLLLTATGSSYVFTAADLSYRCYIPECDCDPGVFQPQWLQNAVPMETKAGAKYPSRCYRYQPDNSSSPKEHNASYCPADMFQNTTERCYHWVYDGPETTILNEWGLACDDVGWRLGLVGTVNNIGWMLTLPMNGYLSDKFGRRPVILGGLLLSCGLGFARTLATSYLAFLALEGLCMLLGGGTYQAIFVLALETVGPDNRVLGGSIVFSVDSCGFVLLSLVAMWLPDWRTMLGALYVPWLLLVAYYWLLPESPRWLLLNGRTQEAKTMILKAARINRVVVSNAVIEELDLRTLQQDRIVESKTVNLKDALQQVFQTRVLLLRLLNCCFCWASNAFVYHGLSLNSVSLVGNKYLNFTLTALADLPGVLIVYFTMDWLGRKVSISTSLMIAGVACLAHIFTPPEMSRLTLVLFLLGKLAVCGSFCSLYAFTAEIFPTSIRNSMMGTCSMVGRVGSILATQTPTLGRYMSSMPLILFGATSLIAGLLALLFPETRGTNLPDSLKASTELGQTYGPNQEAFKRRQNSSDITNLLGTEQECLIMPVRS